MTENQKIFSQAGPGDLLLKGQKLHEAGKFLEAAKCYQALLQENPQNLEALLSLSLVARQSNQYALSLQLAHEVVRLNPHDSRSLINLAHSYRASGAQSEAISCCEAALKGDPQYVIAHCVLGEIYYALGEKDTARRHFREAIRKNPGFGHAYCCFGNLECQEGNFKEAVGHYLDAVKVAPEWAEAHFALGYALHQVRERDGAIGALRRALELRPRFPEALLDLGNVFFDYGEMAQAAKIYRLLVRMDPTSAKGYCNLGNALVEMNQFSDAAACYQASLLLEPDSVYTTHKLGNLFCTGREWTAAETCFRRVLEKDPNNAEAHNDFGNIFFHQRRLAEAAECYRKAIELKPGLSIAYANLGNVLQDMGDYPGAIPYYEKSVALDPTSAGAHYNLALSRLCEGDYRAGWRGYEWRWDFTTLLTPRRPFRQPLWRGEPLQGKRILLHAEQGLGDTLQFIRYVPMVAAHGGYVILEVAPNLTRLLSETPGVNEIVSRGNPLPHFDYQCPLMSLPLAFDTTLDTIPSSFPYVKVSSAEVAKAKAASPGEGLRIGLTWAGNPLNKRDDLRSLSLKSLLPLAEIPGVSFFALQQGPALTQLPKLSKVFPIHDACSSSSDFRDTAALVGTLDLIISVDTAVAHLAGAMNKPVWLLLPYVGDWRWMRNRDDNPWYPTARLFRQPSAGDWAGAVARLAEALTVWVQEHGAGNSAHASGPYSWPGEAVTSNSMAL